MQMEKVFQFFKLLLFRTIKLIYHYIYFKRKHNQFWDQFIVMVFSGEEHCIMASC